MGRDVGEWLRIQNGFDLDKSGQYSQLSDHSTLQYNTEGRLGSFHLLLPHASEAWSFWGVEAESHIVFCETASLFRFHTCQHIGNFIAASDQVCTTFRQ